MVLDFLMLDIFDIFDLDLLDILNSRILDFKYSSSRKSHF